MQCRKKLIPGSMLNGLILIIYSGAYAGEPDDMGGWGLKGAYNRHYDVKEFEKLRAWVKKVKTVVPAPILMFTLHPSGI